MEELKEKFINKPALPLNIIGQQSGQAEGTVHFALSPGSIELTLVIEETLQEGAIPTYLIYDLDLKTERTEGVALVVTDTGLISPEKVTITSDDQAVLFQLENEYAPGKILIVVSLRITRKDICISIPSECRPHHPPHPVHPPHPHHHHHSHDNPLA
jgi:hypothetical protein